jgi:hypothetical protein
MIAFYSGCRIVVQIEDLFSPASYNSSFVWPKPYIFKIIDNSRVLWVVFGLKVVPIRLVFLFSVRIDHSVEVGFEFIPYSLHLTLDSLKRKCMI